jgi:hypothetical protein
MILKFAKHSVPIALVPMQMALEMQSQVFKFWLGENKKMLNNVVEFKKASAK